MDDDMSDDYEMEESESTENQDRLSELPHSLILHILSFLPMKDVISTTILSKRWKNLWITVPCLNFCDYIELHHDGDRIRNFINRALMFWKGTKILKFTIDFDGHFNIYHDTSLAKDIDLWVLFAKEYNVEELNIRLAYESDLLDWSNDAIGNSKRDIYRAPQCLNSCSSIKKLSLVGCNLRMLESPPWDQLESLRIDGFCLSEGLINRVLSGAPPRLEVFKLRLLESNENLNIRSRSLKELKIDKYLHFDDDDQPSTDTLLRIRCPNLETLEVSGVLYCECLLSDVSSLTDATLGFYGSHHYDNAGLSGEELLGALSPLSNVKSLKLDASSIELDNMMDILGIFPKLKTLIIENKGCLLKRNMSYCHTRKLEENSPSPLSCD